MVPLTKVLYVAGPFRADSEQLIQANVERARAVGMFLRKLGAYPVIPHLNTGFFFGLGFPEEQTLTGCVELVRRCDGVVLQGAWWKSTGTRLEYNAASAADVPVFLYDEIWRHQERFSAWLRGESQHGGVEIYNAEKLDQIAAGWTHCPVCGRSEAVELQGPEHASIPAGWAIVRMNGGTRAAVCSKQCAVRSQDPL